MSKYLFFLFFLLSIIELSKCQEFDKDMMRAVACISLIRKLESKPSDQRELSAYMLSCFIMIDDSTTQKLLMSQNSNKLDLTQEEISKLTDMHKLEGKFTEDQIMDYSKDLNSALSKLQKAQPGGMRGPSKGGDFNSNERNSYQSSGIFAKIFTNFLGLFTTNDSLLFLFGMFIVFYLFLRQVRKMFGSSEKNKNEGKKSTKTKKKMK